MGYGRSSFAPAVKNWWTLVGTLKCANFSNPISIWWILNPKSSGLKSQSYPVGFGVKSLHFNHHLLREIGGQRWCRATKSLGEQNPPIPTSNTDRQEGRELFFSFVLSITRPGVGHPNSVSIRPQSVLKRLSYTFLPQTRHLLLHLSFTLCPFFILYIF